MLRRDEGIGDADVETPPPFLALRRERGAPADRDLVDSVESEARTAGERPRGIEHQEEVRQRRRLPRRAWLAPRDDEVAGP